MIVAAAVSNLQPDNSHLVPMLEQTRENAEALPVIALNDAGYWKVENANYADTHGIDLHVSTRSNRHATDPPQPMPSHLHPRPAHPPRALCS